MCCDTALTEIMVKDETITALPSGFLQDCFDGNDVLITSIQGLEDPQTMIPFNQFKMARCATFDF
jgi:hypothetical protein